MKQIFKLKVWIDNQPITKCKTDNIKDFDNVFLDLKKKLGVK